MLADGLRLPTVAIVWLTDLDQATLPGGQPGSELVMRRTEAQAIAQPLARILWKHREDWALVRWLLSLESQVASQSDYIALALALGHYGTRIADLVVQAYAYKAAQAAQAEAARQVGGNGARSTRKARTAGDTARRDVNTASTTATANTATAASAPPAPVAGPEGIGEQFYWNGGPFGATPDALLAYSPGLADPIEAGDWLGSN